MANGIPIIQGKDPLGGLRQFFTNIVGGTTEQVRNQQLARQLGVLFPGQNLQGITDPRALQAAIPLGLQRQAQQSAIDLAGTKAMATLPTGSFQQIEDPETGQQINALVDTKTGNIIRRFGGVGEDLSKKEKTTFSFDLGKQFRSAPVVKNLAIIERSERGMAAALKQATSPNVKSRIASDQTLGVLFQKMLDPESVVRESEFARTPEGAAAINRILAIAPQLRLGGLRLLDEDREALVSMARKLLTEAKISFNKTFDEFEAIADETGLNKRVVFGSAKKFDIGGISTTPTGGQITTPKTQADFDAIPLGTTFIDTDGKRKVKQ